VDEPRRAGAGIAPRCCTAAPESAARQNSCIITEAHGNGHRSEADPLETQAPIQDGGLGVVGGSTNNPLPPIGMVKGKLGQTQRLEPGQHKNRLTLRKQSLTDTPYGRL